MERNGLPHVALDGFSVDIAQTLDYICVCRWGTAGALRASRPVRRISSSLHQSLCTINKKLRWSSCSAASTCTWNLVIIFFVACRRRRNLPPLFCRAEIQQSTKWNPLLVKTTYTSCRLLHRSTRVATVTLCLCAAVAGLQRTFGVPCCARRPRTFTAGSDLCAAGAKAVRAKDGNVSATSGSFGGGAAQSPQQRK